VKIKIPTLLIEKVIESVDIDYRFNELKEPKKQKLIKRLIEFWFFIYQKQIDDNDAINLKFYTDIHSNNFTNFGIKVGGIRLNYKDLLKLMSRLIESNGTYFSGQYSTGYRINTDFLKVSKLTECDIDLDLIFKKTLSKEFWLNKYPNNKNLIEDCYNASIDLDDYLFWMQNNIGIELNPVYNKKTGILEKRFLTEDKVYLYFCMALKVNLQNLWFKISDEGRFYSSISNLPKSSVKFIRLYNEKTTSVDISNCQPLLLSTMIDNKLYKKDCVNGLFYDELIKILPEEIGRNEIKVMCYKYIFFGKNKLKSGKLYNAMNSRYNGVVEQINKIKEDTCLAKKLQTIESNIFVNNIGKLKVFKLLRHDEVIVSLSNESRTKDFLIKEFDNLKIKLKL